MPKRGAQIRATDRRIARFTMFATRNGRIIPRPRRTPSVAILIPMKMKKVTKPSHIITRHLIGQRRSVFSQEQRGNLRVQRFNDHKRNGCKAQIQHQCSVVPFFDALGLACAKVLGNKWRNRIADGDKKSKRTHSLLASSPNSLPAPVCRMDLQLPAQSAYRWTP